jgi:fructosamine-3-kinase
VIADRVEAALGRRPDRLVRVGARVWRVDIGRDVLIAKAAPSHLASESRMLADLAAAGAPVPRVHYGDDRLIVMDHVETDGAGLSDDGERALAETLAALHANTAAEYGHGYDAMIGDVPQINERFASWIDFFRWKRLDVAAWLAVRRGRIPPELNERLWRLGERLREWLIEPPRPALLHGDLRIGNVLCRGGQPVALIGPAIAYGHPEFDLAVSRLGGFRPGFLRHYLDIAPAPAGFLEVRCGVYQLYPLLVRLLRLEN